MPVIVQQVQDWSQHQVTYEIVVMQRLSQICWLRNEISATVCILCCGSLVHIQAEYLNPALCVPSTIGYTVYQV